MAGILTEPTEISNRPDILTQLDGLFQRNGAILFQRIIDEQDQHIEFPQPENTPKIGLVFNGNGEAELIASDSEDIAPTVPETNLDYGLDQNLPIICQRFEIRNAEDHVRSGFEFVIPLTQLNVASREAPLAGTVQALRLRQFVYEINGKYRKDYVLEVALGVMHDDSMTRTELFRNLLPYDHAATTLRPASDGSLDIVPHRRGKALVLNATEDAIQTLVDHIDSCVAAI